MESLIQGLIDAAGPSDTVTVPAGTYTVDYREPIRLKSNLTLDLREARIQLLPNTSGWQQCLVIIDCENVDIVGGSIVGERGQHLSPDAPGAGGGGIIIAGNSHNIRIRGTSVAEMWADGIYMVEGGAEIGGVTLFHNRRQGLTVSNCNVLWVHDSSISNTGGEAPGAGIDLEADLPTQSINNVKIEHNRFANNAGAAVLVATAPQQRHNIIVTNNTFIGKPCDGTDGLVPFFAKWLAQAGLGPALNWFGYPRELHIP